MIRKILLCTDGSEGALRAARTVADLARPLRAEVVLASVFSPPVGAALWTNEPLPLNVEDVLHSGESVRTVLTKESAAILAAAGVTYRISVETGDPVQSILDLAQREEVDLVVVGSRGLGGFQSLLLGSVSDSLAHNAPCPVLIVR